MSSPSLGKRSRRSIEVSPTSKRQTPAGKVYHAAAPASDHVRVFSWNVNGIEPFLQSTIPSSFAADDPRCGRSLREFLRRHHWPTILCLQEVKISPKDETTKTALERAANRSKLGGEDHGPGYSAHYSLPRDKFNAKGFGGRVYGVVTFIRDDCLHLVGVTKQVAWDLEGRFLVTELHNKLVLINGYWVNGTENPYRDSKNGAIVGTRHDRKRAVHQLMLDECKSYEAKGWIVALIGDMNIARGPLDGYPGIRMGRAHATNRADFNAKFFDSNAGMKAVDVIRHLHGDARNYTYYPRNRPWGSSCDRVDLIILSRRALDVPGLLVHADILETYEERGHSDHVPLYVTLDLTNLGD